MNFQIWVTIAISSLVDKVKMKLSHYTQPTLSVHENGLPRWLSSKESSCQAGEASNDPEVGKTPGKRKWQPTPVFLLGKPMDRGANGLQSAGRKALYICQQAANQIKEMPQDRGLHHSLLPHRAFWDRMAQGDSSPVIKQLTWILKKGRFSSQYKVSLT